MTEPVRWLDEQEARAWETLQLMQMRLNAELARRLGEESGMSYPDYVVLVALTAQADGRIRAFELGHLLGWEKSRVSHHVARMAERGLVTREKCDADRRGSYIAITTAGRGAIEAAAPGHVAAVRQLFVDRLTPEQLDVIAAVAEIVLGALDEAGCPPPDPAS